MKRGPRLAHLGPPGDPVLTVALRQFGDKASTWKAINGRKRVGSNARSSSGPYSFRVTPHTFQTILIGQTSPCSGAGRAQIDGRRRRSSSKKFSRMVAWTVAGSALLNSGGASTTKRRPSGAMSRFQRAL